MNNKLLLLFLTVSSLLYSQNATIAGLDLNGDGFLSLRIEPKSTEIGKLYNGDKVRILQKRGKYYKVEDLKSTKVGWAHSNWITINENTTRKKQNMKPNTQSDSTLKTNISTNEKKLKVPNNEFKFSHKKKLNNVNLPVKKVIVTGMGIDEQKAIKNATKSAIQQVVGMYVVSDTVMKNRKLIKDEVLTQSNAYVKSFKTLNKSKDEDGLYEIEAEVEVEVGKLAKTLSNLNIAVKGVGSDELKAKASANFSSISDFKAMVQKVIIEPIQKNNIYEIKINGLDVVNDDVPNLQSEGHTELTEEGLVPFRLSFSMSLSGGYINSIESFLENASKESSSSNTRNSISIYKIKGIKSPSGNILKVMEMPKKTYTLSSRNFNIYKKQMRKFKGRKKLNIKISFLDTEKGIIKEFGYLTDTPNMLPKDRTPIYIDNKYYTDGRDGFYLGAMSTTDRGRSGKFLEGIPHYKDIFYVMGAQKLFTYLYLNEEEAAQIDTVKITTSWGKAAYYN